MNPIEPRFISESVIVRLIGATEKDHCISCHSDFEGYEGNEIDLGKGRWTNLCCGITEKFKAWKDSARHLEKLEDANT